MQQSVDGEAGPVPFPLGQVGYSRTLELNYFLSKGRGMMIAPRYTSSVHSKSECQGSCPPPPPCTVCLQLANLAEVCDLCKQVTGSDEELCCEKNSLKKTSSESLRSKTRIYSTQAGPRIYSTRVGQGRQIAYYDAAMSFLPKTAALLTLSSLESTQESRAYLIIQIQLPAKFK